MKRERYVLSKCESKKKHVGYQSRELKFNSLPTENFWLHPYIKPISLVNSNCGSVDLTPDSPFKTQKLTLLYNSRSNLFVGDVWYRDGSGSLSRGEVDSPLSLTTDMAFNYTKQPKTTNISI